MWSQSKATEGLCDARSLVRLPAHATEPTIGMMIGIRGVSYLGERACLRDELASEPKGCSRHTPPIVLTDQPFVTRGGPRATGRDVLTRQRTLQPPVRGAACREMPFSLQALASTDF